MIVGNSLGSLASLMVSAAQRPCGAPASLHVEQLQPLPGAAGCACLGAGARACGVIECCGWGHTSPRSSLRCPAQVTASAGSDRVAGTVLLNCAGGMNNKVHLLEGGWHGGAHLALPSPFFPCF